MCRAPAATCASDVRHDDLRGHYPEAPVVDGHNRAVTAAVLAAAARFGRPGNPHDVTHTQLGVAGERRQGRAIGDTELDARHRQAELRAVWYVDRSGGGRFAEREPAEIVLEFGTQDIGDAKARQQPCVERRVESERAQAGRRIELAHATDDGDSEPCRRVHGQEEPNQRRLGDIVLHEPIAGHVGAAHLHARRLERRRGRGQPERLTPQVVGGDQQSTHE